MSRPRKSIEEKRESAACRKRRFNEKKSSEGRRQYNSWVMWPKETTNLVVVRCCGNCPEEILKGDTGLQLKFDDQGKVSIKRIKFGTKQDKPSADKPAFEKPAPAAGATPAGSVAAESASGQQDHTETAEEARKEAAAESVVTQPAEPEPVMTQPVAGSEQAVEPEQAAGTVSAADPEGYETAEAPACAKPKKTFPPGELEQVEYEEFDVSLVDERIGEQSYSKQIARIEDGLRAIDGGLVFHKVWGRERKIINDLDKEVEEFAANLRKNNDMDHDNGKRADIGLYMKWQLYIEFHERWNEADKYFLEIKGTAGTIKALLLANQPVPFPVYLNGGI